MTLLLTISAFVAGYALACFLSSNSESDSYDRGYVDGVRQSSHYQTPREIRNDREEEAARRGRLEP